MWSLRGGSEGKENGGKGRNSFFSLSLNHYSTNYSVITSLFFSSLYLHLSRFFFLFLSSLILVVLINQEGREERRATKQNERAWSIRTESERESWWLKGKKSTSQLLVFPSKRDFSSLFLLSNFLSLYVSFSLTHSHFVSSLINLPAFLISISPFPTRFLTWITRDLRGRNKEYEHVC